MNINYIVTKLLLIFLFLIPSVQAISKKETKYQYDVEFEGIDEYTKKLLVTASELLRLKDEPPLTAVSLQARIDDDVTNLLKALQSLSYYNAKVDVVKNKDLSPTKLTINISTGPIYRFAELSILPSDELSASRFPVDLLCHENFDITAGEPAYPEDILSTEDKLISLLEKAGYPLAEIIKREVIADQSNQTVRVVIYLDSGPLALFGTTDVTGNRCVLPAFFVPKISWSYGEPYNPCDVQKTINALEQSGLFSSISISHDNSVEEDNTLPMHIEVKTAKMRSIAFGAGYATDLGAGATGEWEHRNISGMGDKLSLTANVWQIKQEGFLKYTKPDFIYPRQDLICSIEGERENVKAYRELSLTISAILERQLTDRLRISYGTMLMLLRNRKTDDNGEFNLFKIPLQAYWNGANSTIEPTSGVTYLFRTIPTLQTRGNKFAYCTNVFTTTAYQPLDVDHRYVLAAKATLGTIWGVNKHTVPPSERFYAGSDSLLRGYHYLTVSPLNFEGQPIGGRSLMVYSLEARLRVYDPFGVVFFYDVGNVYSETIPKFNEKVLQSAGIGLRYHTPVGPIRLDFAVPFNRRKHLDQGFQVYFSIGQSF